MTKIITVVAFLSAFGCTAQDMGKLFSSRDVVRMDLWIFGLTDNEQVQSGDKAQVEELKVALDKINL